MVYKLYGLTADLPASNLSLVFRPSSLVRLPSSCIHFSPFTLLLINSFTDSPYFY